MAISNATRLSDFGAGIGTQGAVLQIDNTNDRIGIGTTNPSNLLQVGDNFTVDDLGGINASGVVTATTFAGNLTGTPTLGTGVTVTASGGINASGVVTATTFVGALTGNVTGNTSGSSGSCTGDAAGLTGTPDVTVDGITANDINVSGSCTITGNLTVDGTQTIVNTSTLDVADKTVGIASTTNATDSTADGAGIEIYASHSVADNNKTLTWERDTGCFTVSDPFKFKGVVETVAAASTHETGDAGNFVLEMDLAAATIYTYSIPGSGNIGVVSFKNMPADTGVKNAQTVTLITTQSSSTPSGFGNTTAATGIGTYCRIGAYENGAVVTTGVNTAGKVSSASTVTLSSTTGDVDITSFLVDYNGGTNTTNTSYKVYVTQSGGFRFGNVGI